MKDPTSVELAEMNQTILLNFAKRGRDVLIPELLNREKDPEKAALLRALRATISSVIYEVENPSATIPAPDSAPYRPAKRFCKDCRHSIPERFLFFFRLNAFAKCSLFPKGGDLVTGKPEYWYCTTQRTSTIPGDCGPRGTRFMLKRPGR